ncbi:hypothetical protein Lalb_Chr21g0317201 [Lupinus albus]|uniref:Uncharacterized protein n=1 Tax=Lupinus albus TaxID=3870 RepID=A0A6A4NUC1_LUPAL|nr:hypothetical protein Lalb_Chr21g0317201 [Lupinus albus]
MPDTFFAFIHIGVIITIRLISINIQSIYLSFTCINYRENMYTLIVVIVLIKNIVLK